MTAQARGADDRTPDRPWLRSIPKAELHVHLDGSLRPATMLELAAERGVALPAVTPEALGDYMVATDAADLVEYLERFAVTLSVMQDAEALERIAYECVVDHAREGVRYVEIRFCPLLNTERGLTPGAVLDAALAGVDRAVQERRGSVEEVDATLIVCALRSHAPRATLEMAELAVSYRGRGVVGFDLAGPEAGYPVRDHVAAFDHAAAHDVPITIHAGEAYGPASILEALDLGHAARIGHGTRLFEDERLLARVLRERIPLEVCVTSNVQTGVVESAAAHPARRYIEAGLPVTLGTDNRLISGVSLTDEYEQAVRAFGLSREAVVALARTPFEHTFLPPDRAEALLRSYDDWAASRT